MADDKKSDILQVILGICAFSFIFSLIIFVIFILIGGAFFSGCYGVTRGPGAHLRGHSTKIISVRADGNYDGELGRVQNKYGQWLNTGFYVYPGQEVRLKFSGNVSLCQGYLPKYNLRSDINSINGETIIIPRLSEQYGLPIIFPANKDGWRNVLQVFDGDRVEIKFGPEIKLNTEVPLLGSTIVIRNLSEVPDIDIFNLIQPSTVDCSNGKKEYNPACNRFSPYKGNIALGYTEKQTCWQEKRKIIKEWFQRSRDWVVERGSDVKGILGGNVVRYDSYNEFLVDFKQTEHLCNEEIMPLSYSIDRIFPKETNITTMPNPHHSSQKCPGVEQKVELRQYKSSDNPKNKHQCHGTNDKVHNFKGIQQYYWLTSTNNYPGIYSRLDVGDKKDDLPGAEGDSGKKCFLNTNENTKGSICNTGQYKIAGLGGNVGYLQFKYFNFNNSPQNNTGGYVIYVKQDKCYREDGQTGPDPFYPNRGKIKYAVTDTLSPPTKADVFSITNGSASITPANGGNLWLLIDNKSEDYKYSVGNYNVEINVGERLTESFISKAMKFLFQPMTMWAGEASKIIFKNLTCYKITPTSSCISFFSIIRVTITLYVVWCCITLMLGISELEVYGTVIKILKMSIIAGLINGSTFDFFQNYLFDAIMNFSDELILSFSDAEFRNCKGGYECRMAFLDPILTNIFLDKSFLPRLMAVIGFNGGSAYFSMIICGLVIFLISVFRLLVVYFMSLLGVSILLGMAPIFICFILFERTKSFFDNWVKYLFRYMIEPVIGFVGIVIFTHLFYDYFNYVLGHAVCWKCFLPIKIPYLTGIFAPLSNKYIFCLNWFVPWGFDPINDSLNISFANVVALMIVAYAAFNYMSVAGSIAEKLTETVGGYSNNSKNITESTIGSYVKDKNVLSNTMKASFQDIGSKTSAGVRNAFSGAKREIKDGWGRSITEIKKTFLSQSHAGTGSVSNIEDNSNKSEESNNADNSTDASRVSTDSKNMHQITPSKQKEELNVAINKTELGKNADTNTHIVDSMSTKSSDTKDTDIDSTLDDKTVRSGSIDDSIRVSESFRENTSSAADQGSHPTIDQEPVSTQNIIEQKSAFNVDSNLSSTNLSQENAASNTTNSSSVNNSSDLSGKTLTDRVGHNVAKNAPGDTENSGSK